MTKIVLNGREVEADPEKPLVEACRQHAQEVPIYCYHPGLSPVGSCRICQVEVRIGEMPPRVMVACRTPVTEGMVVDTEAPAAHEARRECLEFLLKNHPLDCPICDKAGECDLQDYAFQERQGEGRSVEPRRKLEKRKSLGDVIVLDEERCILCSRCVRFCEEITKKPQLTVAGLGSRSVIATFGDRPLEGNYQGNLADVCPVGALTLEKFRFQARVWNLTKHASSCGECSRGCAITVEVLRRRSVERLRPRFDPEVNEWWMCDHGRFSFDRFNEEGRLQGATIHGANGVETVAAPDAVAVVADVLRVHAAPELLVSPWLTVEEGERVVALARALGVEPAFLSPPPSDLADDLLHTGDPCPNRRGLSDLGITAVSAEEALERLAGKDSALLVGERIVELLGAPAVASLPARLRLVVLDTRAPEAGAASMVCVGVPNAAERTGTWINVDGLRRGITVAKPPPPGVPPLTESLDRLIEAVVPAEVEG